MNDYECVQAKHHKDVGPIIKKRQAAGWHLHTYQAAGVGVSNDVNHYLLFERER